MNKFFSNLSVFIVLSSAFLQINGQNRKAVSGAEVTGTFRAVNGNEFQILALGEGRLRVAFSGIYEYDSAYGKMADTGEAEGIAEISGNTADFLPEETEDCTIKLKFLRGGKLEVEQDGDSSDCGFGVNVYSDGSYKKISNTKPKF